MLSIVHEIQLESSATCCIVLYILSSVSRTWFECSIKTFKRRKEKKYLTEDLSVYDLDQGLPTEISRVKNDFFVAFFLVFNGCLVAGEL